jgi:hypothetical protein
MTEVKNCGVPEREGVKNCKTRGKLPLINTRNLIGRNSCLFDRLRQMSNYVAYRCAAWTRLPPQNKPLPDCLAWCSNRPP